MVALVCDSQEGRGQGLTKAVAFEEEMGDQMYEIEWGKVIWSW